MAVNGTPSGNAQAGPQTQPSPFTPPQISLSKGGGATRGIDEKFAANSVTGTGSLSVALALSAGRSGFGPKLSVEYDSGGGNGVFGLTCRGVCWPTSDSGWRCATSMRARVNSRK